MGDRDFERQMQGWSLTTAEIMYRLPDFQNLLQTYIWQDYDLAPKFPALIRFIDFWKAKLEGPLHSVRYTHKKLISPSEWKNVTGEFALH